MCSFKMRLINIHCNNRESFKYSVLLYFYYYNIKKNHSRPVKIDKSKHPYLKIIFNRNNDLVQFERDNPLIDLFNMILIKILYF